MERRGKGVSNNGEFKKQQLKMGKEELHASTLEEATNRKIEQSRPSNTPQKDRSKSEEKRRMVR